MTELNNNAKNYRYTMRKLKASDIFAMSKILKKMDIKKHLKREEGQTNEEYGQNMFMTLLENIGEAEAEFNKFFGSLVNISEEEFGDLDIEGIFEIFEQFKEQDGISRFLQLLK